MCFNNFFCSYLPMFSRRHFHCCMISGASAYCHGGCALSCAGRTDLQPLYGNSSTHEHLTEVGLRMHFTVQLSVKYRSLGQFLQSSGPLRLLLLTLRLCSATLIASHFFWDLTFDPWCCQGDTTGCVSQSRSVSVSRSGGSGAARAQHSPHVPGLSSSSNPRFSLMLESLLRNVSLMQEEADLEGRS